MEIKSRHIGGIKNTIIEITVTDWGGNSFITENVTNLHGKVDINFIMALRTIADELEEQNSKIAESE